MKSFFLLIILVSIIINAQVQDVSNPEKSEKVSSFELVIEGISDIKGEVRIAVFNSEKSYSKKEDPLHAIVLEVKSDTVVWSEPELPFGEYAIAVYHDKNMNGKLDSNFLGMPKEAYGFSNNARGKFGPASWKDAHFTISSNTFTTSIHVK